jgi:hypothetical protein
MLAPWPLTAQPQPGDMGGATSAWATPTRQLQKKATINPTLHILFIAHLATSLGISRYAVRSMEQCLLTYDGSDVISVTQHRPNQPDKPCTREPSAMDQFPVEAWMTGW